MEKDLISLALEDVARALYRHDDLADSSAGSKIYLFIFPLIIISIPFNYLVNYLYEIAVGCKQERSLQPSLSKPQISPIVFNAFPMLFNATTIS